MRPADTWKDYELLDATDGNRLERWGETILIRPDPQVVWKTPKQSPLWAKADAVYHRSNQGGGEWEYKRRLPEKWKISCGEGEDKLTLIVRPHRLQAHRRVPGAGCQLGMVRPKKIRAAGRPVKVLNLFGYTGGATLGLCGGRCHRLPCGCLQGHRGVGQGQCCGKRPCRPTHPLAGGRLCQVRCPRKTPRQHLRRHHHGPTQLRARPRR